MTDNNKTLVSAGHELASELKAECGAVDVRSVAALLNELASALDVQSARSDALAAENAGLKSNLIYWDDEDSEPVRSPLDYAHGAGLEDGEEFDMQVAARMPNLTYRVVSTSRFRTEIELVSGPLPETPATDAFLAEVRAQGVDAAIESAKKEIASEFQYQSFDNCISACARHPQSDLSGKVEMVAWLEWFAAQLRGGRV